MNDVHFTEHSESISHFIDCAGGPDAADGLHPFGRRNDDPVYCFEEIDFEGFVEDYAQSTAYVFEQEKSIPTRSDYVQGYSKTYQTRLNCAGFTFNHGLLDMAFQAAASAPPR